jgi:hypothetical protein
VALESSEEKDRVCLPTVGKPQRRLAGWLAQRPTFDHPGTELDWPGFLSRTPLPGARLLVPEGDGSHLQAGTG